MNEIVLRTPTLVLRPFRAEDAEAVQAYAGDIEVLRYMLWGPNDEETTRWFLSNTIEKNSQEPRMQYDFAVCLAETGELIGGCGIYPEEEKAHLGWVLNKRFWKRGYGTELAAELIRFGFEDLRLDHITATCDAENVGSYRVMERNGMKRTGYIEKCRETRNGWRDELHYAITREEWESMDAVKGEA